MKAKTKRMINKYGEEMCIKAYELYGDGKWGGRSVGEYLGVKTNTADALINAGRDIQEQ